MLIPAQPSVGDPKISSSPPPDKVFDDIANYVHNYEIKSDLAYSTGRLTLMDTIGCGLEGMQFPARKNLRGPEVEGTVVPNGARVPGTPYELDPVRAAFAPFIERMKVMAA